MTTTIQAQDAMVSAMYGAIGAPVVAGRAFMELGGKIGNDTRASVGEMSFDDPTAAGQLFVDLGEKITFDTLATLAGMAATDEWVAAGREMTGQLQESKMLEQVQTTMEVEIEQIQDTVGVLREQLEDALVTWRDQFAPSVQRPTLWIRTPASCKISISAISLKSLISGPKRTGFE